MTFWDARLCVFFGMDSIEVGNQRYGGDGGIVVIIGN